VFFPNLIDIATRKVITINAGSTLARAAADMDEHDIQSIIITHDDDDEYGLLSADDLICLRFEQMDFDMPIRNIEYEILPQADFDSNILEVLHLAVNRSGYICVLDEKKKLTGIVSNTDIISSVDPEILMEEQQIGQIQYDAHFKTASAEQPAFEVIGELFNAVGHSVIIMDGEVSVGILTNKDAIRLFNTDKDLQLPVKEYMSSPLETIDHRVSVKEALDFIKKKKFKRLVLEGRQKQLLGVIVQKDLINTVHSKWADLMRKHEMELKEINKILENRAKKLEKLAATDHLTGILNRSRCEELLEAEISRNKRYRTDPFSIIIFDIDHFKAVNDTYGHATGDLVLKKIADSTRRAIRASDFFARWGGEEFFLLLPHTNFEQAKQAAEKLRQVHESTVFSGPGQVTSSFGAAQFKGQEETMESIVKRADDALYIAKRSGRNRVEGCH